MSAAYKAAASAEAMALVPNINAFGKAMADFGIAKKRLSTDIHYVGLDLVESPAIVNQAVE